MELWSAGAVCACVGRVTGPPPPSPPPPLPPWIPVFPYVQCVGRVIRSKADYGLMVFAGAALGDGVRCAGGVLPARASYRTDHHAARFCACAISPQLPLVNLHRPCSQTRCTSGATRKCKRGQPPAPTPCFLPS